MAQPDIIRGTYFVLMLGDGATPTEVFTALCGITTRRFTGQVNTNDVFTRDCADPVNVPVRRVIATGKQFDLSGEGTLNRANLEVMWAELGNISHWRYLFTEPADDEVYQGYWGGSFMMTNFEVTAEDADFANISIQMASDGDVLFTEVTPV